MSNAATRPETLKDCIAWLEDLEDNEWKGTFPSPWQIFLREKDTDDSFDRFVALCVRECLERLDAQQTKGSA